MNQNERSDPPNRSWNFLPRRRAPQPARGPPHLPAASVSGSDLSVLQPPPQTEAARTGGFRRGSPAAFPGPPPRCPARAAGSAGTAREAGRLPRPSCARSRGNHGAAGRAGRAPPARPSLGARGPRLSECREHVSQPRVMRSSREHFLRCTNRPH